MEYIYLYSFIVLLVTYFIFLRPKKQTVVITTKEGEKIRRAAHHTELVATIDGITTIYDSWTRSVKKNANNKCVGTRPKVKGVAAKKGADDKKGDEYGEYEWKTYAEVHERCKNFASGLVNLGAKRGDRVGIFSKNREEWLITQQACYSQALCIVSFYETLGKESIRHVANHSEIKIAVCSFDTLDTMVKVVEGAEGYKGLKQIIVMESDKLNSEEAKKAQSAGIKLLSFADVEQDGLENPQKENPPKPKDLSTIMYTSGTTGMPKGVPLTHANLVAMLSGIETAVTVSKEVYLSYLPFAHIFERIIVSTCLHSGSQIGFYHGDTMGLMDDLKVLKPTVLCGVPRIFDRIKQGIWKKVDAKPFMLRFIFRAVYNVKKVVLKYAPALFFKIPILDNLLYGEIRAGLGGRLWILISAGAPLSADAEIFLRICFGCAVSQAYGLTETGGASSVKLPGDVSVNHLGSPLACNELKLVDLPDMGYTKTRGELLIRGANVTAGYYKDEEKTKESFKDGWFLTGDIAEFTSNGCLRIIDRKKNMFKLAQGEYVAAEKVEGHLTENNEVIHQIFVYGDSEKSNLVAIVVPRKDKLIKAVNAGSDFSTVCASKEAQEYMLKNIKDKAKASGLYGFETPTAVFLFDEDEGFTVENDMLTPTMKPKRQAIQKRFQKQIDALYNDKDPYKVSGGGSSKKK